MRQVHVLTIHWFTAISGSKQLTYRGQFHDRFIRVESVRLIEHPEASWSLHEQLKPESPLQHLSLSFSSIKSHFTAGWKLSSLLLKHQHESWCFLAIGFFIPFYVSVSTIYFVWFQVSWCDRHTEWRHGDEARGDREGARKWDERKINERFKIKL